MSQNVDAYYELSDKNWYLSKREPSCLNGIDCSGLTNDQVIAVMRKESKRVYSIRLRNTRLVFELNKYKYR